jgi:hypothetical protein
MYLRTLYYACLCLQLIVKLYQSKVLQSRDVLTGILCSSCPCASQSPLCRRHASALELEAATNLTYLLQSSRHSHE